jgi:hypothetical protein
VAFVSKGNLLAHRIIKFVPRKGERAFVTKGDSLPLADGVIGVDDLIGVVTAMKLGGVFLRLDRPWWRALNWVAGSVSER